MELIKALQNEDELVWINPKYGKKRRKWISYP